MSKVTEVRLTLAALINSLEIDLKSLLTTYVVINATDSSFIQDENLLERTKTRFNKEFPGVNPEGNLTELIDFIDFQDSYTLILKNKEYFPSEYITELKSITNKLDLIVPIRNRVMHSRPLNVGDFSTVYTFVQELTETSNLEWNVLFETKRKIEEDPSYVLTLSLPAFDSKENEAYHNLPIPDFDETGFIGRKKDIEDVKKLILGNNRVVSIIGDGGIGKTALALKVVYDILDLGENNPFDLIIWNTAKTTMLTTRGILEIENAVKDFGGIISNLQNLFSTEEESDTISNILEYFEVFNTLLILDNLETILEEEIREFIRKASQVCKIIITSRIGLGELEFRRPLYGLNDTESILLIRQFANVKKSNVLSKLPNDELVKIAKRLHYNPLAIKWFINSVESGLNPNEVLQNTNDLLNFCLSNVYNKLTNYSKLILNTLLAARKNLSDAQLVFLANLNSLDLRRGLNDLFATTFITREISNINNSKEITYLVPEFAREYILKNHPIGKEFILEVSKRIKELNLSTNNLQKVSSYNEFGLNGLTIRNANEKVIARLINEALKASKNKDYKIALDKLNEAKNILPNYFEIYRVSAFIKATSGDFLGAEKDYQLGLEIEPDNPRLLYFYAGFLLFQLDDVENAVFYASKLYKLRPESEYPNFLLARCLSTIGENEQAINLLLKIKNANDLNAQSLRVIYTDIINMYGYWGAEIIQKEGDFAKATEKFLKGLEIFENCVQEKNYDEKMIKNFCNCLKSFIKTVPKIHNKDNIEYIKSLLVKYDNLILLNQSKNYLLNLLKNNYDEFVTYQNIFVGKILQINREKKFAFIKSTDGEEIYANKRSFKYVSDFYKVKVGTKVNYEKGENKLGICAINIVIT